MLCNIVSLQPYSLYFTARMLLGWLFTARLGRHFTLTFGGSLRSWGLRKSSQIYENSKVLPVARKTKKCRPKVTNRSAQGNPPTEQNQLYWCFFTFSIPPALMQDFPFIDAGLCLATRGPQTSPKTMVWVVLKYYCFSMFFIHANYVLFFRLPETGG